MASRSRHLTLPFREQEFKMDRQEIQKVLEVCAARLESEAVEFKRLAKTSPQDDAAVFYSIALVLRLEARFIRTGCKVYEELPTRTQ